MTRRCTRRWCPWATGPKRAGRGSSGSRDVPVDRRASRAGPSSSLSGRGLLRTPHDSSSGSTMGAFCLDRWRCPALQTRETFYRKATEKTRQDEPCPHPAAVWWKRVEGLRILRVTRARTRYVRKRKSLHLLPHNSADLWFQWSSVRLPPASAGASSICRRQCRRRPGARGRRAAVPAHRCLSLGAILFVVFAGAGEVAGLLFGLLLLRSHAIELRFVEHDLDCVVPPQIGVLGEDRANPLSSSLPGSSISSASSSNSCLHLLELLPQLVGCGGRRDRSPRAGRRPEPPFRARKP